MINVTLKGGVVREYENGTSVLEIAKSLGAGLYKAACAARVNGTECDLRTVLDSDCEVEILTFDDDFGKMAFRHTCSHILAQAVKRLYPNTKLTIGPSIEDGFYYDFDSEISFTPEVLEALEKEMKKIVKENLPIEKFELEPEEAIKMMEEKGETYKIELIKEHADKGEKISFYRQGEFVELCAGPHLPDTSRVKAFKLTSCTGAYWRGDANNKMLQRIYGTAFTKASELEEHLQKLEEAKKRDHNKLGRELGYFSTVDYIGQGLPILLPKGARVIQLLQRWVEDVEQEHNYLLTKTPLMAKRDLYRISGHWDHYLDGMFVLGDPNDEEKECLALRPMTCPFQYQVYLNQGRSYRDLPMRLGETSTLFRNEDSGEMHGLIRVRQFTISEGHLVLRPDQLEEEFEDCLNLCKYFLGTVGLLEDCTFRFSQWDPNNTDKYEGTAEQWETAQATMKKILDDLGVSYKIGIGEAAFYGPKLDIQYKNVFGKEDTIVTIQIDMLLAEKFGMYYTDKDGQKKLPYIIHRTSLGCYERTLAYLIEKYAGAFPLWLAPEQIRITPVADRHQDTAFEIKKQLEKAGIKRVEVDTRSEKLGYKLRSAQLDKIPYILVVGDKEAETGTISVRKRGVGDIGSMEISDFVKSALADIDAKVRW
ncbi:MAG: threonine--tRNA ligase [Oscillospiraceae bacterium]|nr:threonine--tRNA ligase [Oscillospiraceae bacterium]